MRFDSSLILAGFGVVLLAVVLAAFHPQTINNNKNISELQMILNTDKETYYSGETMAVEVNLTKGIENATLSIRGIKDSRGTYRIQKDYSILLGSVQNQVNFTFVMPSCYGCAGISPGEYEIFAELISGSVQLANATKVVRLEKE
ncbi:MAG: hypothetical protein NTY20_04100 [Candidatus Aenigmarchaeota archaeon]|nr:hypothetical protein [Candidatus Aenigmarchaeota archaeon]